MPTSGPSLACPIIWLLGFHRNTRFVANYWKKLLSFSLFQWTYTNRAGKILYTWFFHILAYFIIELAKAVSNHQLDFKQVGFGYSNKKLISVFSNLIKQNNEKSLQRWLDHELEVMVNVHEVRFEYEKQSQVVRLTETSGSVVLNGLSPPRGKNGHSRDVDYFTFECPMFRMSSMSPNARLARIATLENMLNISSNALVAMASQLSEAEERERAFTGRGRWNQFTLNGRCKEPASIYV
ncbi:Kinesin-like protein KIN-4A [Vitis vinifera]|uniref:Kinesin-like protein KIN-4A n=1 Tax=Vitis vinifera TaxID=29760 RepID=A0A438FB93_VITVI|nr:Kinesin-like protein KIN-4A [Vitis vinifera]